MSILQLNSFCSHEEKMLIICGNDLASVGTELIFCIVCGFRRKCFGSGRKATLITHRCFSCCWAVLYRVKDVSVSQTLALLCQWGLRGTSCWEGTEPGQLTQKDQGDIPKHTTSNWTIKPGELAVVLLLLQNSLGISQWGGEQLCCASPILYIPLLLLLLSLLLSLPFQFY